MISHSIRTAAGAAAFAVAAFAAVRAEAHVTTYRLSQPGTPVEITQCVGSMKPYRNARFLDLSAQASADYRNVTGRGIAGITERFYIVGPSGRVRPELKWDGRVDYAVAPHGSRTWTVDANGDREENVAALLTNPRPGKGILCTVSEVRFADGSIYRAPLDAAIAAQPGPYAAFPATPY